LLPPQVQLDFEIEDGDYDELVRTAKESLTEQELDKLAVEHVLRQALIEFCQGVKAEPAKKTLESSLAAMGEKLAERVEYEKNYTVLLLYPDYLSSDDPRGFGTYCGHGTGTPEEAVAQVRLQAADANNYDHDDDFAEPIDYAVLAVFEGVHEDINPECPLPEDEEEAKTEKEQSNDN
jgi:hypothetical protein